MRFKTSVIIQLLCMSISISHGLDTLKQKKVLFVGNSLTYFNDMPQTVQKMCDEQKLNLKIDQITYPGARLSEFAKSIFWNNISIRRVDSNEQSSGVAKILSNQWDRVILQEAGGVELIPEFQLYSFEPSLTFLDSIIKSIHGKTVLYQAYTGKLFPRHRCESKWFIYYTEAFAPLRYEASIVPLDENFCTKVYNNSESEYMAIKQEYDKMAEKLNADQVKIGYAFEEFKKTHPEIPVYVSDTNTHPSLQGSYLIACMFFRYLTDLKAATICYSAFVEEKQAKIIREFADTMN